LTIGLCFFALTCLAKADDILPKRPEFGLYQAMLTRSPFAVATVEAAPAAQPDFARDWYVANAARSQDGDLVTIASTTDRNFKEYLSTKEPNEHGFAVTEIKWSDRLGETKVTITKDGKYATLGFNQALLAQPVQNPAQPLAGLPLPQPVVAPPYVKPAPVPSLPNTQVPMLPQQAPNPQNRFRSRGLIQRALVTPAPTPNVPTPAPDDQD
jgi:hypothetical protein